MDWYDRLVDYFIKTAGDTLATLSTDHSIVSKYIVDYFAVYLANLTKIYSSNAKTVEIYEILVFDLVESVISYVKENYSDYYKFVQLLEPLTDEYTCTYGSKVYRLSLLDRVNLDTLFSLNHIALQGYLSDNLKLEISTIETYKLK